jgi:L-ascorbate metabolism protein UlaG (beta-lactamase superfamily)
MNFTQMKNERLVAFYENVRQQVAIDMHNGGKYRFVGDGVKEYADKLRLEIDRRRLQVRPIDWPA